ncbi:hypothetical protein BV22DRAFT_362061 [Leucogyrophana mollusca]|uniref:Uncharacterized protein n=1 Tax=Leucogyrophana mollusca TaxID=85980 RepID=A0ACB8BKF3_9AGAM|nr:hypothetical protein BV22DRAFT_362061 [Leucogyrophana mollusca]
MAGTTTAPATFPDLRRRSARLHPDDELTPRALRALKRHRLSLDIDPLPSPPKRRKENSVLRNPRPKVSSFPRAATSAHGDVQQPQKRPSPSAPLAPKHSSTQPKCVVQSFALIAYPYRLPQWRHVRTSHRPTPTRQRPLVRSTLAPAHNTARTRRRVHPRRIFPHTTRATPPRTQYAL